jgi:hypothetical protein
MPTFLGNLPVNSLVVHVVVVLVPLAILGGLTVAVWPRLSASTRHTAATTELAPGGHKRVYGAHSQGCGTSVVLDAIWSNRRHRSAAEHLANPASDALGWRRHGRPCDPSTPLSSRDHRPSAG